MKAWYKRFSIFTIKLVKANIAKNLMSDRDKTRSKLKDSNLSPIEKQARLLKYRKLRNKSTQQIRLDKHNAFGERIARADNENEIY